MTEARSTLTSASIISLSALCGAGAGFVLQLLVAFYFGASAATDAYFMAQSTSDLLSKLLLGGSIASVFIPMFVERLARGNRQEAWRLGLNLIHVFGSVFIVALILLWLFAAQFISFIAPGFDSATAAQTVSLLRILLPSFLLLFWVDLITAMLHSLKQFLMPALLRIITPVITAITLVLLVRVWGIHALATGVVIGSVVQLTFVAAALARNGFTYRFIWRPTDKNFLALLYLVYPFIFSVLMTQAAGIVYRILVSDLSAGSLSALKYSEKMYQLLVIMFLNAVTTVIFPLLSEKAGQKDWVGMQTTIASAIRLLTVITIPLMVGVALLREPLITFIFQRGSFTPEDTAMTTIALLFMVIGLTINGISSVLGHAVLALKKTKISVAVSIVSQVVAISLFVVLVPRMGHAGLALGGSLVPIAIATLYFLYLTKFLPTMTSLLWHPSYFKIIVLGLGLAGIVQSTLSYLQSIMSASPISLFIQIVVPAALGSCFFFGGAYVWKIAEIEDIAALAKARWRALTGRGSFSPDPTSQSYAGRSKGSWKRDF